jgi:hypothetical protein
VPKSLLPSRTPTTMLPRRSITFLSHSTIGILLLRGSGTRRRQHILLARLHAEVRPAGVARRGQASRGCTPRSGQPGLHVEGRARRAARRGSADLALPVEVRPGVG